MCVTPHPRNHHTSVRGSAPVPDAPAIAPPAALGPTASTAPAAIHEPDAAAAAARPPDVAATIDPRTDPDPEPEMAPDAGVGRQRLHRPSLVFLLCATVLLGIAIPLCADAETERAVALVATTAQLFDNIRNWLMGILAGLATVFFSVGGTRYLMAGGDPGEVEAAKRAFKAAAVGYCLAALAPLVLSILQQIIGAS